jgi:hypothetical protein
MSEKQTTPESITHTLISSLEFHSLKLVYAEPKHRQHHLGRHSSSHARFKPRKVLNSFSEHTPHARACCIPMVSMTLNAAGIPRARNAFAESAVASWRMRARSPSSNRPVVSSRLKLPHALYLVLNKHKLVKVDVPVECPMPDIVTFGI